MSEAAANLDALDVILADANYECTHNGRAGGPLFERCLFCGSWRLGSEGRWHPQSMRMPMVFDP